MIVRALDLRHSKVLPAAVCKYTTCHGTRPKPSPLTVSILILSLLPYIALPQTARGHSQSLTTIHFTVAKHFNTLATMP